MKYQAPSGWVETFKSDQGFRLHRVFHRTTECPRVHAPATLKPAARPGAAARCRGCAPI